MKVSGERTALGGGERSGGREGMSGLAYICIYKDSMGSF